MTHFNSSFVLSPADQVTNAKRVQALDCVDCVDCVDWALDCVNCVDCASTNNNDANNFQRMLPDLKIAESYRQAETKAKYVL